MSFLDQASRRRLQKYQSAKLKIDSFNAFMNIRAVLQKDQVYRYMFIIAIRKVCLMIRVSRVLIDYSRDKHIFVFKECKESKLFKKFLRKWDDNFTYEEYFEDEEFEDEDPSENNYKSFDEEVMMNLQRKSSIKYQKKSKSYVDMDLDFQRLKTQIKSLENSLNTPTLLRKKKSFKFDKAKKLRFNEKEKKQKKASVKKLLTFKFLILTTFNAKTSALE